MGKQSRDVTIAFAGSGASTPENTTALLNDFLGFGPEDKDGFFEAPEGLDLKVILPFSDTHVSGPVMDVHEWTDLADAPYYLVADKVAEQKGKNAKALFKYAESTDDVRDVNAAIIDALKEDLENGREVYLFLFWGEEGDENSEILLDLASSAGIKTLDVTAGLDDLSFEDETPTEEPNPEPEPEPEERPRRGRRRQQEDDSQTLEDKVEEPSEKEEKPKRRGRVRSTSADAPEAESKSAVTKAVEDHVRHVEEHEAQTENESPVGNTDKVLTEAIGLKHAAKALTIKPDIFERFSYHPANDVTAPLHAAIRKVALEFAHYINEMVPDGREKSLALTKIEEAQFWANAGVARRGAPAGLEQPIKDSDKGEPQEAESKPSRGRGRPRKDGEPTRTRTAAEKAVKEIWDEDEQEWVKAGRGRIPKGAKTRLVDPKTGDVVDE